MNIVDACTKEEITAVHQMLSKRFPPVYADIWKVGLNLSLRISDLLALRYADLDLDNQRLSLIEQKTGKRKDIALNPVVIAIVQKRHKQYPKDVWLFQAHSNRSNGKPLDRGSVGKVFKAAGDWLGLNIGTHSMRKSRGAAMFNDGVPLEMIAKVLNHSNTTETLRYIGITKKQVGQTYIDYVL